MDLTRHKAGTLLAMLSLLFILNLRAQSHLQEMNHVRGKRYCEILVVSGKITSLTASVYNTLGCNDCPSDKWKRIDQDQLKILLGARAIMMNGPRVFVMDKIGQGGKTPPKINMGGLEMVKRATVPLSLTRILKGKSVPYRENVVNRSAEFVYQRGKKIYELVSPVHSYIMLSFSLQADPYLNEAALDHLTNKLKLPKGWKYEVITLTRDLELRTAENADTYVIQDDLLNSYQRLK